jgi:Transposase.
MSSYYQRPQIRRLTPKSIIKDLGFKCCEETIIKALHEFGYSRRIARRRPSLKNIDKKRRLEYARSVRHKPLEYWKSIIFTDEMSIKVHMERRSQDWIWRKPVKNFIQIVLVIEKDHLELV